MSAHTTSYRGYRFPPEIIGHAVWLYFSGVPRRMVTDKLRSYPAAHRTIMPSVAHDTSQFANNWAEISREPTRLRAANYRMLRARTFVVWNAVTCP